MPDITGHERGSRDERDAADHCVAQFAGLAGSMASPHQQSRFDCGRMIEGEHAAFERVRDQPGKRRLPRSSALSGRHY